MTTDEFKHCDAETAGYSGWFGVYCERPIGHDGPHVDGDIIWQMGEWEPVDVMIVKRRPLLREASRVVLYETPDGRRHRVIGSYSSPHWKSL